MKNWILTLTALISLNAAAAGNPPDEPGDGGLPSPYFIDEVHCSGINVHKIQEGWLLSAEEVEPAKKIDEADLCERIFRAFGIQKYQWLSPDDLERTAIVIRQSGYFLESDLSVQKSELKNHVHVYLRVKPTNRWTESIADDFKMYGSKGQGSGRLYDALSFDVTDHAFAPTATNSYGVNLLGTHAASAMQGNLGSLMPGDQQELQMQNQYLAELYWKKQGVVSPHISYDFGMRLDEDKTYSDGDSRLNMVIDGDVLLNRRVNIVNGQVYIGPAFIFTTYTPYEITPTTSSSGIFLPGFVFGYDYGHAWGNFVKFKLGYYNSAKDQQVFRMDFDLQKHWELINSYIIAGFKNREATNAVLPEDRFPLTSPNDFDAWIGLSKIFRGAEYSHQVGLVVGYDDLSYSNNNQFTYDQDTPYVGLRYKMVDGSWDINLAASYYFQRTY